MLCMGPRNGPVGNTTVDGLAIYVEECTDRRLTFQRIFLSHMFPGQLYGMPAC